MNEYETDSTLQVIGISYQDVADATMQAGV